MSSGSYFLPLVKAVEIPKKSGGSFSALSDKKLPVLIPTYQLIVWLVLGNAPS